MFAFVLYAVLVWYFAVRWRRRWESFAAVGAGLVGLIVVGYFHLRLNEWSDGQIYLPVMQVLLYPYTLLVAGVGLYIACLPTAVGPMQCVSCRYDLRGLERGTEHCPECGTVYGRGPRPRAAPVGSAVRGRHRRGRA